MTTAAATEPMTPATRPATSSFDVVKLDMTTLQGMEALQRAGNMLSSSTLVPEIYRRWKVDKNNDRTENPAGLSNCVVALNMATRLGADVLMVMQNMHVIEGRPSWSSTFIIATINSCGKFSPLRFDLSPLGDEIDTPYTYIEWEPIPNSTKNRPVEKKGTLKVRPQSCRAWAVEKSTGQRLDGPEVTMQMAIDEGWLQKKGSKWKTMQEMMLRYRSASFFGKLYSPELLMGLQTKEEVEDIIEGDVIQGEIQPARQVVRHAQAAPKVINGSDWTIENLEEFDDLLEKAYVAFKDAGYSIEYQAFADSWSAKRGKLNAEEVIVALGAKVKGLAPAQVAETTGNGGSADASGDSGPQGPIGGGK